MPELPFVVGALYNRRAEIHEPFGGQRQGGISTPPGSPYVFIFTGEAGKAHGYSDFWETDDVFHYYGEGQEGDMRYVAGNLAVLRHDVKGKRLLLFQAMGKSRPVRFLGEMRLIDSYEQEGVPATRGPARKAIVFRLTPIEHEAPVKLSLLDSESATAMADTVALKTVEVRKKQTLFRRRLVTVEKECRLTGIRDLRFVRASHIKPWAACSSGNERTDGHNGLLLTPTADHLFDRGWITFEPDGRLRTSGELPYEVSERIGLDLRSGRSCGAFQPKQQTYLDFHRNAVFETRFTESTDAREELLKALVG
jgi:hypothetical protein